MPLHPQAKVLLEMMAALADPPFDELTPDEARRIRAERARASTEPVHEIRDVDADGIPCRLYRPKPDAGLGLLVFLHGGGFVIGDLDSHDNVCRSLANGSGHAVLSVGYRLAPEAKFPAALEDAVTAVRWAHANAAALGCDPQRLAIGGDSAGGNLAAVVANLGAVPLRMQLLVYPVTDCTMTQPSYTDNGEGYFLTAKGMAWFLGHYLEGTGTAPTDPRVSPLFADDQTLAAAPPAVVITAELDPLRDEGDRYAERLIAQGVPTSHVRFAGMFHGFFSLAEFLDDGRGAVAAAAAMVGAALSR